MLHLTLNFALALAGWKNKAKQRNCLSDLISSMFVYSRFIIKDCSSLRFRESTSITIHNGFSAHHDSWMTKMFHHGVKKTKISSPTPCSKTAYGQTYFKTFLLDLYVQKTNVWPRREGGFPVRYKRHVRRVNYWAVIGFNFRVTWRITWRLRKV